MYFYVQTYVHGKRETRKGERKRERGREREGEREGGREKEREREREGGLGGGRKREGEREREKETHVSVSACIHPHTYIDKYINLHTSKLNVHMHICIYTQKYTWIVIYLHTYIYIHTSNQC